MSAWLLWPRHDAPQGVPTVVRVGFPPRGRMTLPRAGMVARWHARRP